jgi:N-acetylneuraminate synthase
VQKSIDISGRKIGAGFPVFVVAEMSANHGQNFDEAVRLLHTTKECGADAIKLQTYTPDTMTIDSDREFFRIGGGTLWDGETLYNLYGKAYTPWEWQPKLKEIADDIGLIFFSAPFDTTAVDFLEDMDVPVHKVASFELVDIHLIEYIASKGKPIIISTGMATLCEIQEAVEAARSHGAEDIALLKCTSSYPAPAEEMHLKTIPHLAEAFNVVSGLSDHTLDVAVPVASVALGACIIEKHFTLSRSRPGPDSAFSLEPHEFKAMVEAVRTAEQAIGSVHYGVTEREERSRVFRRSLFVVEDMLAGEIFTEKNIRSIRPGNGLPPKHMKLIVGRKAAADIRRGTPLRWELVT